MNKIILPRCFVRIKSIMLAIPILIHLGCSTVPTHDANREAEDSLLILTGGNIELGILADVGGRVVLLRELGGENLLNSDSSLWNEPAKDRYSPDNNPEWKEYGGHIVWLAPQSGWWNQQSIFPEMKDKSWPPDPYIIYGKYDIVESTGDYAKLIGPDSPISGVRLTKEFWIDASGTIRLRVTATNIRDEPISWGLWTTTRFSGETHSYLPLDPEQNPEYSFKGEFTDLTDSLPYRIIDGYFTFAINDPVPTGLGGWDAKVFAKPRDGWLAAFPKNKVFIKRADTQFADRVHDEHGFAEIYNNVSAEPDGWSLLELEFHGPYQKIMKNNSISVEEAWMVFDYDGLDDAESQVAFLNVVSGEFE